MNAEKGGWKVLRFSGSEIYKDVGYCVDRIESEIQHAKNKNLDFEKDLY